MNSVPIKTTIPIQPGDIIYSSKSLSTLLVGHCAIVGQDYHIYHSHPKGAFSDTLKQFISRHKNKGKITLLRSPHGAEIIAKWAQENICEVQNYLFHPQLGNKKMNYCSKFIWQAYWHALEEDITGNDLTIKSIKLIRTPYIRHSPYLTEIGTWRIVDLRKSIIN
ncbi:hypothetical protein GCM10011351_19280 [Paraliobacillus quinghaiensis]|uniref:Uncharacterized protein n=1 Tax=Paraliobacillus quinghaiensis TaxID=470815 RepID=A0A917WVC5_9BACI|nr:YiiX/YebB-like N1pC/P60 family cysteine hydrolase [Paraliobacillus quinghaiensis]GGM33386.1 hypothetical protein GCM10011351_19280 [Paraliobacillus quinghaiensis]